MRAKVQNLAQLLALFPNFERASDLASRQGNTPLYVRAKSTSAKYLGLRAPEEAASDLEAMLAFLSRGDASVEMTEAALLLGETAASVSAQLNSPDRQQRLLEVAFLSLNRALSDSRALDDSRLESYALGLIGRVYGLKGRTEDAVRLTERAIVVSEENNINESLFVWYGQYAGLKERQGEVAAALTAYERATREIQAIRPAIAAGYSRVGQSSSRELIEPILLSYADMLLKQGGKDNIIAARSVVEQLKSIEFERFFEEICVTDASGETRHLSAVADDTTLVYPVVFDDRLELIISTPSFAIDQDEDVIRISVDVPRAKLESVVASVRRDLRRGSNGTPKELISGLSQLHDWLIAPARHIIDGNGAETIVFAPDGALRGVPLAALYDAGSQSYLIEDYAVVYSLGLELEDPLPFSEVDQSAIYAGISEPLTIKENATSFSGLSFVETELDNVSQRIGGRRLINESFTRRSLSDALSRESASVVHLATHATFGNTVSDSYLLAHSGQGDTGNRISLDDLEILTRQARIRGQAIELLVLSACETGLGDPNADSDAALLGLAGVAHKAGARSVLASLWQVDDQSTSMLMTEFYRGLAGELKGGGINKAQALRRAQLALLNDETGRSIHPSHWAAFTLFGNWL